MFVFLVVIPKRDKSIYCPANYIVVNNNNHQIPIGTILFSSVDESVAMHSEKLRQKVLSLAAEVEAKQLQVEETKIKATIMQHLMCQRFEEASELYLENKWILTELSKREIAWYVHPFLSKDPRYEAFFPELPPPLHTSELQQADVTSVEMSVSSESRAKRNLEWTHKLAEKKKEQQQAEKKKKKKKADAERTRGRFGHQKECRDEQEECIAQQPSAQAARSVFSAILDHITHGRMDVASEMYTNKRNLLDGFAKREIAQCVWRNTDEDDKEMIPFVFPGLPISESCLFLSVEEENKNTQTARLV